MNHLLGSMTLFSIFHGGVEREQAVHPQAQLCRWSQCDGNGGNELVSPFIIDCHLLSLRTQRPLEGGWETACIEIPSSSSNLTP